MDKSQFELCLGMPEESVEVSRLLVELGVKKVKLGREGYTRVDLKKQGLILTFKPQEPKSSKVKLTGVQFYSDAQEGFMTFSGVLPKSLSFSDSQKEVRAKLGKPTQSLKEYRLDHWISGGRQLSVKYRKSGDGIALVLLGFPPANKK